VFGPFPRAHAIDRSIDRRPASVLELLPPRRSSRPANIVLRHTAMFTREVNEPQALSARRALTTIESPI
jgi:hypothetical protein